MRTLKEEENDTIKLKKSSGLGASAELTGSPKYDNVERSSASTDVFILSSACTLADTCTTNGYIDIRVQIHRIRVALLTSMTWRKRSSAERLFIARTCFISDRTCPRPVVNVETEEETVCMDTEY